MRLGLCGAQGTGKTLLAMTFSAQWGEVYLDANLRKVFGRYAFTLDDAAKLPLLDRLMLQEAMIDQLAHVLENKRRFVVDRCFIDIAAYTLAFLPYELDENSSEAIMADRLVERCLALQDQYFDKTMLLQPGIALTHTDRQRVNRGSLSWVATGRITSYSHSLLSRLKPDSAAFIPAAVVDFEQRMTLLALFTGKAYNAQVSRFNRI